MGGPRGPDCKVDGIVGATRTKPAAAKDYAAQDLAGLRHSHSPEEYIAENQADDWQRFRAEAVLGASVAGQRFFARSVGSGKAGVPLKSGGGLAMAGSKGQIFEAEVYRYLDETTEFQVQRLTDPSYSSTLPGSASRAISRNSGSLIYCSDRSGSPQAFRLDLKSGDQQQLTDHNDLNGRSLTMLPDSRSFCFFAGRILYLSSLGNLRERPIYAVPEGWEPEDGLHAAANGAQLFFAERRAEGIPAESRLRAVSIVHGTARTVLENPFLITDLVERPQHAQILYRQAGRGLWLTTVNGEQNGELKLAGGGTGPAFWSADGKALLYLNFPEDPKQLNNIREYTPDTRTDKLVAKTSQYVAFSPNRDASVFVGASRNAASPAVLIMLRIVRRELTLCEHRASHPEKVSPLFAPDAQRIYFQSDRHGKSAIYALHVERLVERIEEEGQ